MSTLVNKLSLSHDNDELDFSFLMRQLFEHKWLILVITSVCFMLGFCYTLRLTPQYQPDTLIQIEESSNNPGNSVGSFKDQFFFGAGRNNQAQIQTALIKSRFILEPVIESLGLDTSIKPQQSWLKRIVFPSQNRAEIQTFIAPANATNHPFKLVYDHPDHVILYDNNNKILLQGKTGTLLKTADKRYKLQVDHMNAPIGAAFVLTKNSIEKIIDSLIARLRIEDIGGKQNIGLLNIAFRDNDPQKAVKILNEITAVTQAADSKKKLLEASNTLNFLYEQLPLAKKSLEKAELTYNHYRAKSGKIDMRQQTRALLERLSSLDKRLAHAQLKKLELSQQVTVQHPNYIALNKQISGMEKEKLQMESTLKKLPNSDQVAVNLLREIKVRNTLYTVLLSKIQKLQVIKAGTISNIHILYKAQQPDIPLPSKKRIIYIASILLGLLLSALTIYGSKLLFPRIEDPNWSERRFDIPNLAIIPYSEEQYSKTHPLHTTNKKSLPLLAHVNPRNLSIESLRSLRTNLQLNLACASNRIISVLGVCPGVGKTFISCNLSYLLATVDKKVLIIDADLRRGSAHKYFDILPENGLSELIQGTISSEKAMKKTLHPNLTIIPRGHYPSDPSELLSRERFKELMNEFCEQFDLVIIDTPPILLVTDAVLLASISAINYLVLGSSAHQPTDVELVIRRLTGAGVTVNGSIFNFYNAATRKSSYQYKYNYYYDESMTT